MLFSKETKKIIIIKNKLREATIYGQKSMLSNSNNSSYSSCTTKTQGDNNILSATNIWYVTGLNKQRNLRDSGVVQEATKANRIPNT